MEANILNGVYIRVLSIAPTQIVTDDKTYILHNPLLCSVTKEDGNFIIENEILDIYAVGENIDEAEIDFYNEFDASFQLLNGLLDNDLSDTLLRAKTIMNAYVKEIITS